jgi:hypothetical protein
MWRLPESNDYWAATLDDIRNGMTSSHLIIRIFATGIFLLVSCAFHHKDGHLQSFCAKTRFCE